MKMAALLTRNAGPKPGVTGTARVDRDIDRLLRRVGPGDIVILDALDLDRITADALVEAEVAAVVNASSSISGRYPNLGPEVLVANGVTLIDETGPEVFKKVKDGAKVRLHNGGIYNGDRRLVLGNERSDEQIHEMMHEAKSGLVAHLDGVGVVVEHLAHELAGAAHLLLLGAQLGDVAARHQHEALGGRARIDHPRGERAHLVGHPTVTGADVGFERSRHARTLTFSARRTTHRVS